jgi:general secretion pathway protein M
MLAAGIVVVVITLFYMLLIDPAMSGRSGLEKKLPALRQQSAEVQMLAREAQALGSKATAPPPAVTRESLEATLGGKGLKAQNLAVTGELIKVQFTGASFAAIVEWLGELQRNLRITVLDANVEAQTQADIVNGTFTLRQQRSDAE